MKPFKIQGYFKMGSVSRQPFTREILAKNKAEAKEKIYSNLGSRHKIRRTQIDIQTITEMKPDDVQDLVIRGQLGL